MLKNSLISAKLNDSTVKQSLRPTGAKAAALGVTEKILFTDGMLSYDFVRGATHVGNSTVRLIIPGCVKGHTVTHFHGRAPVTFCATGWLVGERHVATAFHAIAGCESNYADGCDLRLHARNTVAQFDYNHENASGTAVQVTDLRAANKYLDYAILELSDSVHRPPLALFGGELTLNAGAFNANIIQHPAGKHKRIAIRNNLTARLTERDLAYFTDTDGGSSGAAVCNDHWQVIALHRGADTAMGRFEVPGNSTTWINIGTRIDVIIADLKANYLDIWREIDAAVIY